MDPKVYQAEATRTECNQNYSMLRMQNENPLSIRLNHAVLGLTGEVGELAGAIERWLYYGRPLDAKNIKEELGDCMWYIALACRAMNLDLDEVMEANIRKLKIRYPDKYTDECAAEENRNRSAESGVLETIKAHAAIDPAKYQVIDPIQEPPILITYPEISNTMGDSALDAANEAYDRIPTDLPEFMYACSNCPLDEQALKTEIKLSQEPPSSIAKTPQPPYDNYQRLCSSCGMYRIHKNNTAGVCPDCYAKLNPQSH